MSADKIAVNFGDRVIAEQLVKLPNYEFVAITMENSQPGSAERYE